MASKGFTVKLVFGGVQVFLAFLAIVFALSLKFDLLSVSSSMNIPQESLNFYVVILLVLGFISAIGGLFQVYDWWDLK